MDFQQLRTRIECSAPSPTWDQIKDLETNLGFSLPPELAQLLKEINGGRFVDDVQFRRSTRIELDVGVRGLVRIEDGHYYNLATYAGVLRDTVLEGTPHVPVFYTFSSNLFVFGIEDRRMKLWLSDYDEVIDLEIGLAEFFDSLEFSDPNSEFERACRDLSFEQIREQPWFREKSGDICTCAAVMGNLKLVADCLENGLPPRIVMRAAALNGHADILDHLLSLGWDINETDESGRTVFDWASWKPAYQEIVRARGGKSGGEAT
jgi:hypothetical protein